MSIEQVIRPSAVLSETAAYQIMRRLTEADVSRGGVWNASSGLWQRYDRPWDGPGGTRGNAQLIGSVAVMYDHPARHQITIYKVSLTPLAAHSGYTVESLVDEALSAVGLTLANCPRVGMSAPPPPSDPWRRRAQMAATG